MTDKNLLTKQIIDLAKNKLSKYEYQLGDDDLYREVIDDITRQVANQIFESIILINGNKPVRSPE